MKFLPLLPLLPLSLAFSFGVSADDLVKKSPDNKQAVIGNVDLSVPGDNPLEFCEDPEANSHILRIQKVDLSPNPPLP
jgi:hypothetical protein